MSKWFDLGNSLLDAAAGKGVAGDFNSMVDSFLPEPTVPSEPVRDNFFGIDTSLPLGQTQGFFSDDEEKMEYYRRQEEQEQARERVMFNTNRILNRESGLDNHFSDSVWTEKRKKRYERLDAMHRSLSEADDFGGLQDFWGQYGDEYTRLGSIFDDNF